MNIEPPHRKLTRLRQVYAKNRLIRTLMLLLLGAASLQAADHKEFNERIKVVAEKGDAEAQCMLGGLYTSGAAGVAKDAVKAAEWYRKAAEQGHAHAQSSLGGFCLQGYGMPQSYVEAYKWYSLASAQSYNGAKENLIFVAREMTPRQIAEAQRLVREFKPYTAPGSSTEFTSIASLIEKGNSWMSKLDSNLLHEIHVLAERGEWDKIAIIQVNQQIKAKAEKGDAGFYCSLGELYSSGVDGVIKDDVEAVKWYRKAADQGEAECQYNLGACYAKGEGVNEDAVEAVKWYRKAAEQGFALAQYPLAAFYFNGNGVARNYVEAYKWCSLALAQGSKEAKTSLPIIEARMTREQVAEAQHLAREFAPRRPLQPGASNSRQELVDSQPLSSGTGFFITEDGFLVTNEHVIKDGIQIRLVTSAGIIPAKVVTIDRANDLALLKAEGRFPSLPISASRAVHLGNTVATVGFPNIGLQGFAPKLAKGEIAALSGAQDDPRYFQISVPVQPGNSGGALVDEHGNVVGVVSAKLSARAALATSGAVPENVNYAVKSSFLLSFLESVPEVSAKLKEPNTKGQKFEDVVKAAEQAAVSVLVY